MPLGSHQRGPRRPRHGARRAAQREHTIDHFAFPPEPFRTKHVRCYTGPFQRVLVTLHIAPSDQEDRDVAALAALRPQITEPSPRYFSTLARVHTTIVTHDCNARANSAGTVDLE